MVDKKEYAVLNAIVGAAKDEESIALEKEELLSMLGEGFNETVLNFYIEDLCVNEMLELKYSNERLYVLAPLKKGRVACEKRVQIEELQEKAEGEAAAAKEGELVVKKYSDANLPITAKKVAFIAFVAAFLGAFGATLLAFLLARL